MTAARLMVLSYPEIKQADLDWILAIRAKHPLLDFARSVPPHFTLVFPTAELESAELVAHVEQVAANFESIPFMIRCAQPIKEVSSPLTHLFLTPDEGYSGIVRLHDALYTGILTEHLRLDIPFISHITVGYANDPAYVKAAADSINSEMFAIHGQIAALDVMTLDGADVTEIAHIPLAASS